LIPETDGVSAPPAAFWPPMKKQLAAFLTAFGLSLVSACGNANASAAGTYELDKTDMKKTMMAMMPTPPAGTDTKETTALVDKMVADMKGTIELKADGTATMSVSMPPALNESTAATWKVDGNTITLTPKGKDAPKTAKFANGTITVEQEQGGKKMSMVFRKK
jgi:hypothetical protein